MYQWHEDYSVRSRTDYVHGGLVTQKDYSYSRIWSRVFEDSQSFMKPTTCALTENLGAPCLNPDPSTQPWWVHGPDTLQLGTVEMGRASGVRFGEYHLPIEFINQVGEQGRVLSPMCDFPLSRSGSRPLFRSGDGEPAGAENVEDSSYSSVESALTNRDGSNPGKYGGEDTDDQWCDFMVHGEQSVRVQGVYTHYLNLRNRTVPLTEDFPNVVKAVPPSCHVR